MNTLFHFLITMLHLAMIISKKINLIFLRKVSKAKAVEGLIRVDVFKRKDVKLVVNEFESFAADHHPGGYIIKKK